MDMHNLLGAVRALYAAIERFDAATAARLGLDRTALRAVNAMEAGPVSPTDLAAGLGLTSGSVTALIDRMDRAGHIERVASRDRRVRLVQLTPQARAAADGHYARLGAEIAAAFAALPPATQAAAQTGIATLAAAFDRAAPSGPDA